MPDEGILWITRWRLNRDTLMPEQVRVAPLANDSYVLVEGEDHTSYKGGFFDSPERAFDSAEEEQRRYIRSFEDRLQRIARARERFETQGGK